MDLPLEDEDIALENKPISEFDLTSSGIEPFLTSSPISYTPQRMPSFRPQMSFQDSGLAETVGNDVSTGTVIFYGSFSESSEDPTDPQRSNQTESDSADFFLGEVEPVELEWKSIEEELAKEALGKRWVFIDASLKPGEYYEEYDIGEI
uniref:WWE domain-containing protein n=1 Tax=Steinernema glaseri TaxID=37863 RepID=A0A1I7Z8L6_9BILA